MNWKRLLSCWLVLLLAARLFGGEVEDSIANLPETNPYRAAMLRLAQLPPEERDALGRWLSPADGEPAPTLTADQQALVRELTGAVVAAAKAPATTAADWPPLTDPKDPENPLTMMLPYIGTARELARFAAKAADGVPPDEAMEVYAAVAQFGRQQSAGETLILQLTGTAIDGIAMERAARRLAELSPEQLQRLSAAWAGLLPPPDTVAAFQGERDSFFEPMVRKFLLPKIKAVLETEGGETTGADPGETDSFTRHLRLSALVDLGGGERRISLENIETGVVFTLEEGRVVEGIELVGIDFDKGQAVIRSGERMAVIYLEAKRFVERRIALERLRGLLPFDANDEGAKEALLIWLARIQAHPGGPEGYVDDLMTAYDDKVAQQLERATQIKASRGDEAVGPHQDPMLAMIIPSFERAARILTASATQPQMLQAAIRLRLQELGRPVGEQPADPWSESGTGFAVEKTPDGGFVLRSVYERRPDEPVAYKFGASDAGVVRKE